MHGIRTCEEGLRSTAARQTKEGQELTHTSPLTAVLDGYYSEGHTSKDILLMTSTFSTRIL